MHTEFELAQEAIEAAFRHMHDDYIRSCGLSDLHSGCLRAQYRERGYASKSHLWTMTFGPPETAHDIAMRIEIRDHVADAIRAVNSSGGDENVSV